MSENRLNADQVRSPLASATHRDHAYFEQLKSRLRWQLLVGYVTPLLVLSAVFHYQYNQTLRTGIDNHLRSIAENRRNTVDLFLQERIVNLRNVFQPDNLRFPPAQADLERALEKIQRDSQAFVDLGLFDPAGLLVRYAGPHGSLVGRDYSGEEWFEQLATSGRGHVISDVYLGFRGQPHFILAVRYPHEGADWVLRASVDPKEFGAFVASSHLVDDAEFFIVNPKGQRQTLTGEQEPSREFSYVPARSEDTLLDEIDAGGTGYVRALSWLTVNEWALIVRLPTAQAYWPLRRARLVLVAIMLVTLLGLVLLVRRTTRSVIGRLEEADRAREEVTLQLFSAAKLASVGEMAAGVAHEINNPLAIVYEEASMMKDLLDPQFKQSFDPDEFRERLDAIRDATMRGRDITRKLLAFARQHEPEPEPTDINLVVRRVVQVKDTDFKVSNIEVVLGLAGDLPPVMLGRNQLDQVLLNLLNNAKDAMVHDGNLTLRTRQVGRRVEIDVQDTGCGMPSEILEKVFFPFFTTKAVGRGTGLGLSISYGIIKALGGSIEVASEVGHGTTFTIALPVATERQLAAAASARTAA
ncbi:MAG: ATP-binding protein [Pseudomonadota bacterium]